MFIIIRIILVALSVFLFGFVLNSVRKAQMRIDDTVFWIVLAVVILLMSIFPYAVYAISDSLGFQSPISMVLAFFVFLLIVKCFQLSKTVSQQKTRLEELTQQIAIEQLRHYERRNRDAPKGEDKQKDVTD